MGNQLGLSTGGPQHRFIKCIPASKQSFPGRCSNCALRDSQPAIPRGCSSNTGAPWRLTDDGLPLGADELPQRESRWQVARKPPPWCSWQENTEAGLLSAQCLVRQFHLSLAHQLSADPAWTLWSQAHLSESQWRNFPISLSLSLGPPPLISLHSLYLSLLLL